MHRIDLYLCCYICLPAIHSRCHPGTTFKIAFYRPLSLAAIAQRLAPLFASYRWLSILPYSDGATFVLLASPPASLLYRRQAKKFLAERSPFYMTARKVLRDLKAHMEAVAPTSPLPAQPTWTEADRALAINWKKYLKWEESNPLEIEDPAVLQSRIVYAIKKCLTWMRYYPELW